jgi:hypothetical protein
VGVAVERISRLFVSAQAIGLERARVLERLLEVEAPVRIDGEP